MLLNWKTRLKNLNGKDCPDNFPKSTAKIVITSSPIAVNPEFIAKKLEQIDMHWKITAKQ